MITKDWAKVIDLSKKSIKETELVIALCNKLSKEQEKQPVEVQVKDILDDANYSQEVLKAQGCLTMSAMAKDLGMKSAQQLSKELKVLNILYQDSKLEWKLKADYADKSLSKTKTVTLKGNSVHYLVWTEKGRRWLHALVDRGILQTTPMPVLKKEEMPQPAFPIEPTLLDLIEYIQRDFECLVALAKDCILNNGSPVSKKILAGDIRSINTDASIVMRKLEEACYKSLAV